MLELIQLIILFFVIFDPPASFAVFLYATKNMDDKEKKKTANLAVLVAALISFSVLLLGDRLLTLFTITLDDFRVAGGIILIILGVKMVLGGPVAYIERFKNDSAKAIAAIIGTPLLTGPAAITAIIISVHDYGYVMTGLATSIVLLFTGVLFLLAPKVDKVMGKTAIQVFTTILGLITISWAVKFIRAGLGI
ncbi:MAG: MarC family protein [Nanoarchaeota archaeon]|nr:MarC family protein [Nanoarchaeota archaeon]